MRKPSKTTVIRWGKALLSLWAIAIVTQTNPQNPLLLPALAALYLLMVRREALDDPRACSRPIRLCGALYALMTVAATHKAFTAVYASRAFRAGTVFIATAGLLLFWDACLPVFSKYVLAFYDSGRLFRGRADLPEDGTSGTADTQTPPGSHPVRRTFALLLRFPALVCLVLWLPYFLYEYPGILSPDGLNQIEQVLGVDALSNHHPVAHTAVIGIFLRIGALFTDDLTHQIAFYTLAQMVFLALCCRYVVRTLGRRGFRPLLQALALAFFALMPYNGVMAVFVLKDVPFAGITLLLTGVLLDLIAPDAPSVRSFLFFALTALAFCVFRSNGFYAFLVCVPFLLFAFRRRASFRKLLLTCAAVVVLAALYKGPVLDAFGAEKSDLAENISIPLQQIARVLVDDKPIASGDRALIELAVDTTWIRQIYEPTFADNVKELLRAGNQGYVNDHRGEYFLLWLRLGLRYPGVYLQAWVDQTKGLWYPDEGIAVGMIDGISPNRLELSWQPLLGGRLIVKAKELLLKTGPLLPVLSFLWSMGFFFWALLYLFALTLAQRTAPIRLLLFVPSLALYATLFLATPYGRTFRYSYPFVLCFLLWITVPARSPAGTDQIPQTKEAPDAPA